MGSLVTFLLVRFLVVLVVLALFIWLSRQIGVTAVDKAETHRRLLERLRDRMKRP